MVRSRRLLLDTNILFDLLDKARPQSEEAVKVVRRCNGGGDMGVVSSQSLKDVYYSLCKRTSESYARRQIGTLMDLLVIAPVSAEECEAAMRSDEPDFEDGLIRAVAELNDADVILTRDAEAFKRSRVPSMTCREYLKMVGEA